MDGVENCGYNNLSLLKVVARVFSLKKHLSQMWIMWVYIMYVKTWCIRYDKLTKQNVSWVSCRKALPTRHSRKPVVISVMTLRILVMCRAHASLCRKTSCELLVKTSCSSLCLKSSHSLSHTTVTKKSHIKYRVHKIEQNYNQI